MCYTEYSTLIAGQCCMCDAMGAGNKHNARAHRVSRAKVSGEAKVSTLLLTDPMARRQNESQAVSKVP